MREAQERYTYRITEPSAPLNELGRRCVVGWQDEDVPHPVELREVSSVHRRAAGLAALDSICIDSRAGIGRRSRGRTRHSNDGTGSPVAATLALLNAVVRPVSKNRYSVRPTSPFCVSPNRVAAAALAVRMVPLTSVTTQQPSATCPPSDVAVIPPVSGPRFYRATAQ